MPGMYSPDELDNINQENYHDSLERDCDETYIPEQDDGEEFEDDGQPDEAQEWHDFDPDC
jgi:hypothetical protein